MRSLPPISRDGSTCHFDSREPVARWLKVGSIRWADDLAVRRADRIDGAGDISTVHAPRGSLTEGCTRGDVAFDATPSLPDYCTKLMLLPISFVGDVVDTINKEGTTHTEVFRRGDEALDSSVKVCEVAG